MPTNHLIFRTGFAEQSFAIDCNNRDAYKLASFLFTDFPGSTANTPPLKYDILSVGKQPILSLWYGERQLYFGESHYQLAYTLLYEVIFHCLRGDRLHHALHVGAVSLGEQCLILPGKSGIGKSMLTAWLISHGFDYHTDELVFIARDGRVTPLTMPICLKVEPSKIPWLVKEDITDQIIADKNGAMIPHRLLNPKFSARTPFLTHILFPEFRENSKVVIEELSPAKSCLFLLKSYINAKNLSGHGIAELSSIVRRCRSYKLIYGNSDDLETVFLSSSSLFSQ